MIQKVLENNNLPKSGIKDELQERILSARIKPSTVLNSLTKKELKNIFRSLEKVKISGRKKEKIKNIINYYEDYCS